MFSIFEKLREKIIQKYSKDSSKKTKSKIDHILERDDISNVKDYNDYPDAKNRYQRFKSDLERPSKFNLWNSIIWLNFFADLIVFLSISILLYFTITKTINLPKWNIQQIDFSHSLIRLQYDDISVALPRALNENSNFFTLNLAEMRRILKHMPWVKDVKIMRVWNGKLIIDIQEYIPYAHWGENQHTNFDTNEENLAQQTQTLIDKDGNLFTIPSDYNVNLKNIPYFYAPDGTEKEIIESYTKFCEILKPLNLRPIQIYLSPRLSWELRLDNGWLLKLGRNKDSQDNQINLAEQRLQRFVNNFDSVEKKIKSMELTNNNLKNIDLRYQRGISISFDE